MSDTPASAPPLSECTVVDSLAYLIIRAGEELHALPGPCLREVARWRAPTFVPGAPLVIPGIISQRGVILPVVDLRLALGLSGAPPDRSTRLVVVQHEATEMALLVDAVIDLAPVPGAALDHPPVTLDPARARLLVSVARYDGRPVGVINLAALIASLQEGLE